MSKLNPKSGIKINGKDAFEYHPEDVKALINNDKSGILRTMFEGELMDSDVEDAIAIPENYAEHAGRPNLSELPFGMSENDGLPYIPGHDPSCSGKTYHYEMCKCKYDKWNDRGGASEMWPGGPDLEDFC